jgi:hypothetical protein
VARRYWKRARTDPARSAGTRPGGSGPDFLSARENRVIGRPAMPVEKGYRAATLSDRRCPVLSVVVGWDVAPMWPQGTRRARPARTNRAPAWRRWSKLSRRVRPVRDDHLPRWQGRRPTAAVGVRGSNPVRCCFASQGHSGGWPVSCGFYSPTMTARARPGLPLPGAVRPSTDRRPHP